MKLSERLLTIAKMVPPCKTVADIGTDHGFVPVFLVREKVAARAIASDIGEGPLSRAEAHIREYGLSDRIDCRLGSGLSTLKPGEADVIIIAGLGGLLMVSLLEDGKETAKAAKELILSPHTDVPKVREWLYQNSFSILDEAMVEEDGKFYTMIACSATDGEMPESEPTSSAALAETGPMPHENDPDPLAITFGPILLARRPEVFGRYLLREKAIAEDALRAMKTGKKSESTEKKIAEKEEEIRILNGLIR